MTDQPYDYSEVKREIAPNDNILAQLAGYAMDQKRLEAELAAAQEEVERINELLKQVSERDIPTLMDAAEMTSYKTKDGIIIEVVEKIHGSISEANKPAAFKWLDDNNHSALVKREFNIKFNKNEEAWAKKFQQDLAKRKKPLAVEVKRTVHPSTLAAFVKSQLEAGVDFPMETFGVFRKRTAKCEVPEAKP